MWLKGSREATATTPSSEEQQPPSTSQLETARSARFSETRGRSLTRFVSAVRRRIIPASALSETQSENDTARGSMSNIIVTDATPTTRNLLARTTSRRSTIADEMPETGEKERHGGVEFSEITDVIVVDSDFEALLSRGAPPTILGAPSETANGDAMSNIASQIRGKTTATTASHVFDHPGESRGPSGLDMIPGYLFLRWRAWPWVYHFFDSSFPDREKEEAFQKEQWFTAKPTALVVSFSFLVIWAVLYGLQPKPVLSYTKWTYGVTAALLIAPLFPLVALDLPRRCDWLWQIVLWAATWCLPTISVFDVWQCGFYTRTPHCGGKDFVGIVFWPAALPLLALLMLRQSRLFHAFGLVWYIVIVSVLLIPAKTTWARNLVNLIILHLAILWGSYLRGQADRRMFSLRDQLKQQFKATQKAQVAERAASESKRKFVSYIFHEARVPLNTALIALQNMEGERALAHIPEESKELVTALSSSLVMMEKVLNDVLDFNRMEAGRLVIQNRPFEIHKVFRAVALAFKGAADARQISLVSDLDPAIDDYCPIVRGDETRLLQILSNLLSNACKFTSKGSVRYATRLIWPTKSEMLDTHRLSPVPSPLPSAPGTPGRQKSVATLNEKLLEKPLNDIVILRIEVEDSGVGIRRRDLDNKTMALFSPYVQTEIGHRQGGKGSGLGLALVRQIVKLSGGRLGVCSSPGQGSKFWVELPFGLPYGHAASPTPTAHGSPVPPARPFDALTDSARPGIDRPGIPGEPSSRAELVAAQIPVVTDLEGLPVANLPPLTPLAETPGVGDPFKQLSCLVVDDDALTRKLMARMLDRLGHKVAVAEHGLNALTMLRDAHASHDEFRWQVVFLDNQMPVMTGVETVREVRRIGMRCFVVGLTGNALRDDQDEYLQAGLSTLITKPLLERQLRVTLDEARSYLRSVDGQPSHFSSLS